jgi:hypothetical protein
MTLEPLRLHPRLALVLGRRLALEPEGAPLRLLRRAALDAHPLGTLRRLPGLRLAAMAAPAEILSFHPRLHPGFALHRALLLALEARLLGRLGPRLALAVAAAARLFGGRRLAAAIPVAVSTAVAAAFRVRGHGGQDCGRTGQKDHLAHVRLHLDAPRRGLFAARVAVVRDRRGLRWSQSREPS